MFFDSNLIPIFDLPCIAHERTVKMPNGIAFSQMTSKKTKELFEGDQISLENELLFYKEQVEKLKQENAGLKRNLKNQLESQELLQKEIHRMNEDCVEKCWLAEQKEENDKLKEEIEELKTSLQSTENYWKSKFENAQKEVSRHRLMAGNLDEENKSLKKSNKQKTKMIHKFREQLPPELTYKETTNGAKEGKCEKNTIYYDFNEGSLMDTYYGDKKPVSIYWNSSDDRVDDYMNEHYTHSGGDDWRFLNPIKDKFWKKGKRLCFWTKTNADGYFNIWFLDDDEVEGKVFYKFIDEEGVLYSSVHNYESDIPCKFNEQ